VVALSDVTLILNALECGDTRAVDKLLPAVYQELRQLATQKLAREHPGQTLQATALVHEAYLRLVASEGQNWTSRNHFFGAAAEAMRRILIDNARRKQRLKRGNKPQRVDINDDLLAIEGPSGDLVALDEALTKLEEVDKTKADLVKLRYFTGLTLDQAAQILNLSSAQARRHWTYTRAWLYARIRSAE
jgi:RNA polymerase sigma factor (TIGR02999 family)